MSVPVRDTVPQSFPLTPSSRHSISDSTIPANDEERTGLLAAEDRDVELVKPIEYHEAPINFTRRIRVVVLLVVVISAAFYMPYYFVPRVHRKQMACDAFDSQKLRSNGTHVYKKTSIIVSIDGLRYVHTIYEGETQTERLLSQGGLPRPGIDTTPSCYQQGRVASEVHETSIPCESKYLALD